MLIKFAGMTFNEEDAQDMTLDQLGRMVGMGIAIEEQRWSTNSPSSKVAQAKAAKRYM